jgi:hypothetical protein
MEGYAARNEATRVFVVSRRRRVSALLPAGRDVAGDARRVRHVVHAVSSRVSQGYLQAIYEWQSYIALLTGLDVANASVYDGATALAEGAIMALNATGRRALLVSRAIHPNYRAVLRTYCRGLEVEVDELPLAADGTTDLSSLEARLAEGRYAALALQSPNVFGALDVPARSARADREERHDSDRGDRRSAVAGGAGHAGLVGRADRRR